ncbi:MAG: hypothetical protein ACRCX2_39140 [Paraclostridium sp.]
MNFDVITDPIKQIGNQISNGINNMHNGNISDMIPSGANKTIERLVTQTGSSPVDARSILSSLLGPNGQEAMPSSTDIITLSNLHLVSGLPAMGDNIVDPPPFLNTVNGTDSGRLGSNRALSDAFSTGLVGMDYIDRNIIGGQFLILVPLELKPGLLGQLTAEGFKTNQLQTIAGRLGVANYGLDASIATRRYWRTYSMLLKAAAISLGLDDDMKIYSLMKNSGMSSLSSLLPDHIYESIVSEGSSNRFMIIDNNDDSIKKSEKMDTVSGIKQTASNVVSKITSGQLTELQTQKSAEDVADNKLAVDVNAVLNSTGYINLLKYSCNLDPEVANQRLPLISFFVNGTIERSYSASSELNESNVAKNTVDSIRKGLQAGAESKDANVGELTDYITELSFHDALPKGASFLLSNTAIPKVISGSSTDFSYTVKISEKAVGSDPASLLRVMDLYCKIVPFVTPVSDGKLNTVVPQAPLYCSAFIKGVMNVPKGVITSVSIQTNPQFQTSEGIPTEMDLSITIQPLLSASVIPNMGRFWSSADETSIAASMFNPMSSFNVLATMCGYNSVLSKFPFSMFEYFIRGNVSKFIGAIKGTQTFVTTSASDFIATKSAMFGSSLLTR